MTFVTPLIEAEAVHDLNNRLVQPEESRGIATDRLRSLIDRIERLIEERTALNGDIKDIYQEAKSAGFDVKVIHSLVAIRRRDPAEVSEHESLLTVYRRALED